MIGDATSLKVYLAPGITDMRKSIDGLALIVNEVLELDPFSESLFVFCNRGRNKLKILHWQTNGFWLYYRRLEKGRFKWPTADSPDQAVNITQKAAELALGWFAGSSEKCTPAYASSVRGLIRIAIT